MRFGQDSNLIPGDSIAPEPAPGFCNSSIRNGDLRTCRAYPCTFGQGTGLDGLTLKARNTGLTYRSTEFSMSEVADQGSRFRFRSISGSSGQRSNLPANVSVKGLWGP